jgi:hypothetical protein
MRDSGGKEGEVEEDEVDVDDVGSGDGPSMRSMYPGNDNQPVVALHAEIAVYCGGRGHIYDLGLPA